MTMATKRAIKLLHTIRLDFSVFTTVLDSRRYRLAIRPA